MSRFPEHWMQELLSRNDIADVVGEYVSLNARGGRLWGLCPFHGEKTSSFSVVRDKQFFYCFGCHAGGGVVQFVMQIEKMSFVEAIQLLAQRVGLPLPDKIDDKALQRENQEKQRVLAANREAARFFHARLRQNPGGQAASYLEKRGLTAATAGVFGLGYAPDAWSKLSDQLRALGFSEEELLLAGLSRRKQDSLYDNFRNRLIFPIIAPGKQKQVIGFGGRVLGEGEPKYLNTAETPAFNKRRQLYGANLFSSTTLDSIVLVEGYMDVLSLYQNGLKNTAATLGTALTPQQARLIKRYTSRVYLAYDGDSAGQNAALRALDVLKQEDLDARVIEFPDGLDPDDFIKQRGKSAFDAICEKAWSAADFKLRRMASQYDLKNDDGRLGFAREGSAFIAGLSPIEQERYFPMLSRATDFSIDTLRQEGAARKSKNQENKANIGPGKNRLLDNRNTKGKQSLPISGDRLNAERFLIRIACNTPSLRSDIIMKIDLFSIDAHRRFLEALQSGGAGIDSAIVIGDMSQEDAALISAALAGDDPTDPEALMRVSFDRLARFSLQDRRAALQREADEPATSPARRAECIAQITEIGNQLFDLND